MEASSSKQCDWQDSSLPVFVRREGYRASLDSITKTRDVSGFLEEKKDDDSEFAPSLPYSAERRGPPCPFVLSIVISAPFLTCQNSHRNIEISSLGHDSVIPPPDAVDIF